MGEEIGGIPIHMLEDHRGRLDPAIFAAADSFETQKEEQVKRIEECAIQKRAEEVRQMLSQPDYIATDTIMVAYETRAEQLGDLMHEGHTHWASVTRPKEE